MQQDIHRTMDVDHPKPFEFKQKKLKKASEAKKKGPNPIQVPQIQLDGKKKLSMRNRSAPKRDRP